MDFLDKVAKANHVLIVCGSLKGLQNIQLIFDIQDCLNWFGFVGDYAYGAHLYADRRNVLLYLKFQFQVNGKSSNKRAMFIFPKTGGQVVHVR